MKIIDLLVKIANGEKIPNKIKFMNSIWEYCKDGSTQDYINDYDNCLMEFVSINIVGLNSEVEIIEEPKKIEKCKNYEDFLAIDDYIEHLKNKIDELIDEINNLKGK